MIVVLGLDGLEYDLVEEFKLKAIKLKAYVKTNLEDFDIIVTPPIWASMLIGRTIEDMMTAFKQRARAKIRPPRDASKKRKLLKKITPLRFRIFLGKLMGRIKPSTNNPIYYTSNYLEKNKYHTIFDGANNPVYNGIPGFNVTRMPKLLKKAFKKVEHKDLVEKRCLLKIKEARKDLLGLIEENHDLIFWYIYSLDTLGHIYFGRKLRSMDYYMRVNSLVADITRRLNDTDRLYIISDHGMKAVGEGGLHSNHGFFSSSTGETIRKPQELYHLLKKNLKKEQSE